MKPMMKPLKKYLTKPFNRIRPFFSRLQWKLTLAYTVFTVATILILGGTAMAFFWYSNFRSASLPRRLTEGLQLANPAVATYLDSAEPDQTGLQVWLNSVMHEDDLIIRVPLEETADPDDTIAAQFGRVTLFSLVDRAGNVLVAYPEKAVTASVPLESQIDPAYASIITAALEGETEPARLSFRDANGNMVAAAAILDSNDEVAGAFFLISTIPIASGEFLQILLQGTILPAAVIMLIVGVIAGLLFGFLISRGLTRRIKRLTRATDIWGEGEFSALAIDVSGDELGQLARHMNHMAIQLQNLLQTREELATLEERNRLARDLHDSVKQQVFATAMQIGAAKARIDQNPEVAKTHLLEAEQLIKQSQQELTSLINELRPVALEGKGLAGALTDYAADWSRRTDIAAQVRVRGERPLPLSVEQTFFRVAQEGLANVARHSNATTVDIELAWEGDSLSLCVYDNGQGFDTASSNGKGVGLQSMRERIAALGGSLTVESTPNQGTCVSARLANIG